MITLTHEEAQQVLHSLLNYPMTEGKAIQLLRAKLSEPEPEPVAWAVVDGNKIEHVSYTRANSESWLKYVATRKLVPLYTAPPQREWVGLTSEEMAAAWSQSKKGVMYRLKPFSQAIEAKLKEKNT